MPTVNGVVGDAVTRFLARLQRAKEKKDQLNADTRTVYDDAEAKGIEPAALRRLFAKTQLTKKEREHRDFIDAIMERSIEMEQLDLAFDEAAQAYAKPPGMSVEDADADIREAQAAAVEAPKRGRPKGSGKKTAAPAAEAAPKRGRTPKVPNTPPTPKGETTLTDETLARVEREGYDAGIHALPAERNPWPEGGHGHAHWAKGWAAGDAAREFKAPPEPTPIGEVAAEALQA